MGNLNHRPRDSHFEKCVVFHLALGHQVVMKVPAGGIGRNRYAIEESVGVGRRRKRTVVGGYIWAVLWVFLNLALVGCGSRTALQEESEEPPDAGRDARADGVSLDAARPDAQRPDAASDAFAEGGGPDANRDAAPDVEGPDGALDGHVDAPTDTDGACGMPCGGTPCGEGAIVCDANGPRCEVTPLPLGTVCGVAPGVCAQSPVCDGVQLECPPPVASEEGTTCRAVRSPCDQVEVCDGAAFDCPADALLAEGSLCEVGGEAGICNAFGTCDPTVCIPGAACTPTEPCMRGQVVCDGETPRCEAVEPAAEGSRCGASTPGPWGLCINLNLCAQSGQQHRGVTHHVCRAGRCEAEEGAESRTCERVTEGIQCEADSRIESECRYDGPCEDEGGRQVRNIRFRCDGGRCRRFSELTIEPCLRDSDGNACRRGGTGPWSACRFEESCDFRGRRTRPQFFFICEDGVCTDQEDFNLQEGNCFRSIEGLICAPAEITPWSDCEYADSCVRGGTRSRENRSYVCSAAGVCEPFVRPETEVCVRETDGDLCDMSPCQQCGGGVCSVPSDRCE